LSEPAAISIRNVSFAYGDTPIIERASFEVAPRETVCIVGPNGGGKTTLVRLMLGLLRPNRGEIRVFGRPPRQARLSVGYMPQYSRHDPQFPISAMDVVLMGRLGRGGMRGLFGWPGRQDRRVARDALAQVEVDHLAARRYSTLSGGQRQRVLIARALACEPELLLLDEPTANVDAVGEGKMMSILRDLGRRMAIVTVTHDLGFVSNLVERVVCVNRRVVTHRTSEISGEMIHDLYEDEVRIVAHHDPDGPASSATAGHAAAGRSADCREHSRESSAAGDAEAAREGQRRE